MELKYFDSHCHPQLEAFDTDRQDVLTRMQQEGVGGIVVGVDLATSTQAAELARAHDFLWAAIGLHPNDDPDEEFDTAKYRALAADSKVVAIGECGLDYFRNEPTDEERQRQQARFEKQLELAIEVDKPLIIHCRPTRNTMNAHREMIEILKEHPQAKAILHFFTGNLEVARQYLELGCYLSFPAVITFASEYDEVVRQAPLDRILSETDAPFAAPVPYRGARNEPVYVIETVKKIAALKGVSAEEIAAQTVANATAVFDIKPPVAA